MNRSRRVGGLTLGITLVVFGLLFLIRTITHAISYTFILKLWPAILILLGCEVLVSYLWDKEGNYKYDGFSVLILVVMSFFSLSMAVVEEIIFYHPYLWGI